MSISIPTAGGVPGLSGPPDWLTPPASPTDQNYRIDDARWRGATKQSYVSGTDFGGVYFRATHATVAAKEYVFLTFRAGWAQDASNSWDRVFFGLQKKGTTNAIAFKIQAHSVLTSAGQPSANPPAHAAAVQVRKSSGGAAFGSPTGAPTWIDVPNDGIRVWFLSNTDDPDGNFRWGVQVRIPAKTIGNIDDNDGANIGTDFDMWYVIQGTVGGNPTFLAENRIDGNTTSALDLNNGNYPLPAGKWDEYLLTSGPASFGGVTIEGNWSNDVVVQNSLGTGQTIANGESNTFIARPRNYRPVGNDIATGDIAATFRIANWGSVGGNANQVDWATGVWEYVAPNHDEDHPKISTAVIPTLTAGNSPPATSPINLPVTMNLGANKSLHQCILVTLQAPNVAMNFLQDSVFQNMNYDHASLLEREAEISIVGLKAFSAQPRDVYLALEKINMRANTPGVDEGQFLEATMNRLMEKGGPLAGKLKQARSRLLDPDRGDFGSTKRLQALLNQLRAALGGTTTFNVPGAASLISHLADWLPQVKQDKDAAKAVANALRKLAVWLAESGNSDQKLASFKTALSQWLSAINNDPGSLHAFPGVLTAIRQFIDERFKGDSAAQQLGRAIDQLVQWFQSNRTPTDLASAVGAVANALKPFTNVTNKLKSAVATFAYGAARWLVGFERLDALVDELVSAGVTETEMDQIFPTFRVHVYHDTGERIVDGGKTLPVLRVQSNFGLYAYHEGTLEGWQTSIQGAQRIADNLYLLAVPNNGTAKITTVVQAVDKGEERIPEDPIRPRPPEGRPGCLARLLAMLGLGKK